MNKAISLSFSKLPLVFIILLFSAGYVISCGHSGSPVMSPSEPFEFKEPAEWSGMRVLWSWNVITIDAERENATIVPIRTAESHWNTLKWLEQGPCTNCVQVTGINPGDPGTILVDVSIRHPFPNQNLTGFDVRGIAMFNASHLYPVSGLIAPDRTLGDGEVVNADGYTSLYNSLTEGSGPQGLEGYIKGKMATVQAPDSQLNGYIQYISSGGTARNAFFAEDEILKTFNIDMPDGVFRFGYAVDACWAPPITKPVTDPIADFGPEANCPEAYNLEISKEPIVTGLTPYGGQLKIVIRDYDWQGPDTVYPPVIECPELFDGFVMANWELNYSNGSRYFALITNSKGAPVGNYRCLVAKRAAEYNPSKPWLDLTAYKLIPVEVKDSMVDVTPPYLNFGPMDVDTDGNYLYVASGKNGLTIFDISDPVNPVWQNNICFNTENLYKIVYSNGYAYAVDTHYNGGLRIYDVDPVESASQVKQVKFGIWTRDCKVMGEYAYLTSDDKLIVVDIDPPQNASVIAEFEFGENVFRLDVAPGYAYVATGNDSVIIVDIDPPESAYIVNEVDIPGYANDIHVVDGYAYIAGWSGGLIIVDVDPPESAYVVGTVPPSGSAISVFYANGYAFVGEGFNGIRVVDVDPPDSAFGVKVVEFPGYTEGICIAGEYAYAAANDAGLRVIDINPPVDSTEVNLAPSPRQVKDIVSSEGYLYVSNFNGGFLIIDSDPYNTAQVVSVLDPIGGPYFAQTSGITKSGDLLFAGTTWNGVNIFDVSVPETPFYVSNINTAITSLTHDVVVSGNLAYAASTLAGFVIIDIDPPETPSIVNTVSTPGEPNGVAVAGGYAFVADYNMGLQIIDIDPPGSASIVQNVPLTGYSYNVVYSDGYAFVATNSDGLHIVDVDPPDSAFLLKTVATDGGAAGVTIIPGYAVVADNWNGIVWVDIDPIEDADVVDTLQLGSAQCKTVTIDGNFAYVGTTDGLRIVKLM